MVSKALREFIVFCLGRGASQGTRKNKSVQEGPLTISRMVGISRWIQKSEEECRDANSQCF